MNGKDRAAHNPQRINSDLAGSGWLAKKADLSLSIVIYRYLFALFAVHSSLFTLHYSRLPDQSFLRFLHRLVSPLDGVGSFGWHVVLVVLGQHFRGGEHAVPAELALGNDKNSQHQTELNFSASFSIVPSAIQLSNLM